MDTSRRPLYDYGTPRAHVSQCSIITVALARVVGLSICLLTNVAQSAQTVTPHPPRNLTLDRIFSNAAIITWDSPVSDRVTDFEMSLRPIKTEYFYNNKHITDIDGSQRYYVLKDLFPLTEYEIVIYAFNTKGMSNASATVAFRTLVATAEEYKESIQVHPAEVMVVLFILTAWFCAIGVFLHKWGTIRLSHTQDSRSRMPPKNLDTIKVVKRATDSVIYKNHSKSYTKTMAARQKKIERMNTMPNIKVNIDPKKKKVPTATLR